MSQKVYDVLKPTGQFKIAEAEDISAHGESLINFVPIILTQAEYNELLKGPIEHQGTIITYDENKIYFIKRELPTNS